MNLNDNQKNEFWENGFITINKVFSESFVDKLCSALESSSVLNDINNIHIKDGGHSLELTIINPIFLQLAKDNNILDLIKPLIGPNIQLQHSKSATKTSKKVRLKVFLKLKLITFPIITACSATRRSLIDFTFVRSKYRLG